MPARLLALRVDPVFSVSPQAEGKAMAIDFRSSLGNSTIVNAGAKLALLAAIGGVGCLTWMMLSAPSDARSQTVPAPATLRLSPQDVSWLNPAITQTAITPTEVAPTTENTAAPELSPSDGLKIASQSWRRGGLGSNAQVTFTLLNQNDYPVKDIELLCAFTRRDGSHLTDRTRILPDVVSMKSRKTFARLHVGFVNINANQAKCSLIAADRA
jgi:hypothetical protein